MLHGNRDTNTQPLFARSCCCSASAHRLVCCPTWREEDQFSFSGSDGAWLPAGLLPGLIRFGNSPHGPLPLPP